MVSVDIVHGFSGHCPWTQWTLSMDLRSNIPAGQCLRQWWNTLTFYRGCKWGFAGYITEGRNGQKSVLLRGRFWTSWSVHIMYKAFTFTTDSGFKKLNEASNFVKQTNIMTLPVAESCFCQQVNYMYVICVHNSKQITLIFCFTNQLAAGFL